MVLSGHAIEARLYAEDPENGFLPQSGTLIDWRPASGEGVRIDHGLAPGCTVSPFYDPMLAKVIAHGGDARGGAAPPDHGARRYGCARAEDEP